MIENIFNQGHYAATKQLLDASLLRHEGLASNLANVETPGYKRLDLPKDFVKNLAASVRAGGPVLKAALTPDTVTPSDRKDGNNVVLEREMMAMNRNNAEYDALTEFVSGSIKQLRVAVTGRTV